MHGYHSNVKVSPRYKMIVMKSVSYFPCELTFIHWVKWSEFELDLV